MDFDKVIDYFIDDFLPIQLTKDNRIVKFTYCVFKNYISPDAMFSLNIWTQFTANANRCERFRSKLNNSFYSNHAKIYNFVDLKLNMILIEYAEVYKYKSN